MAATQNNNDGKQAFRTRLYFIIAIVLFVLLALVWSIDTSFIYILLGASAFFLFLGIKNKVNQRPADDESDDRSYQEPVPQEDNTESFLDDLESFFRKSSSDFQSANPHTAAAHKEEQMSRKLSLVVWIFILPVFVIIGLIAIFGSKDDYSSDATTHNQSGDQFYWNAQYDSAYLSYKRALQIKPDYRESWIGLGNIMMVRDDYDSALFYYNKAIEADPAFNPALYGRGMVYYNQKKYTEAINEATAIISRDPAYNDAYLLAGDSYYTQQRYDSALYYYEPAYANGARSQELSYIMAYLYDERGNIEKAIPLYQETLGYDSTIIDIHKRLGELLPGAEGDYYRNKAGEHL